MLTLGRENQKRLVFLVSLFLILDFSVLALNLLLSKQLERDAMEINVSGRQRMLSQAISKNIFHLSYIDRHADAYRLELTINQIIEDSRLYATTLQAFKEGGSTLSPTGEAIIVRPATSPFQQTVILSAEQSWEMLKEQINKTFIWNNTNEAYQLNHESVSALVALTEKVNQELLTTMNALTGSLQEQSIKNAQLIRGCQLLAFLLAMVNFVFILKHFFRALTDNKEHLIILESVINNIDVAVLITNKQKIVSCNRVAEEMFTPYQNNTANRPLKNLLKAPCHQTKEVVYRKGEKRFDLAVSSKPVVLEGECYEIFTLTDITEQKSLQDYLTNLAYVDPLTNLCNRQMIEDRLQQEMSRSVRHNTELSMLFIDLDGFKQVNDDLGHDSGDKVLVEVSKLIKSVFRSSDTIGRFGGDEFIVICPETNYLHAAKLANKLITSISSYHFEGVPLSLGASIGIATCPLDANEPELLKRCADRAMYLAKRSGKNQCRYATQLASV